MKEDKQNGKIKQKKKNCPSPAKNMTFWKHRAFNTTHLTSTIHCASND